MGDQTIESIEGIGPANGQKLREAGITTPAELLETARRPSGRHTLATRTGIPEARILKWANMADLFRVSGIAGQYAELLEATGVDSVKELRNRNAENLAAKLAKVNEERSLCRRCPSAATVADWIDQAKSLPPVLEF